MCDNSHHFRNLLVQGSPCTPEKRRGLIVQGSPCTPEKRRGLIVQGSPCTPEFKSRFFVQGSPETNDNVIEAKVCSANFCLDHCQVKPYPS